MNAVTFATVLRSGGIYTPAYVDALRVGLSIWAPKTSRFVVLTDVPEVGPYAIPLERPELLGWWAKLELFRPGVFDGPVVYLDLDSLPVGPLDDLAELAAHGVRSCLADFYQPTRMIGSGVLTFTPDAETRAFYEQAIDSARPRGGRADYVMRILFGESVRLQEALPGQMVSLKPLRGPDPKKVGAPPGARIVCGHGRPRLHEPAAGWGFDLWRARSQHERRTR